MHVTDDYYYFTLKKKKRMFVFLLYFLLRYSNAYNFLFLLVLFPVFF